MVHEETGTSKNLNIKKENIVLVQEPGSSYIGYVTPESGGAEDTCDAIFDKLSSLGVDVSKLDVVGSDGCNTNTGYRKGIIRKMEERLGRSLVWIICLLHLIELCLKKIYESIYGKGKGPTDFGSELGNMLESCEKLPLARFKKIHVKFPDMKLDDLSNDQKYLFSLALGIKSGNIDPKILFTTPGKLNHARWLTFASRCLRYYVSCEEPSKEFLILVYFILKVRLIYSISN